MVASNAPVRVGLLGIGAMGRHHARVLRETDGVELVGILDAQGDRFDVAGDLPVLSDLDQLLDIGIDAAVVALPTELHEQIATALARRGIHVLVEKPIAQSGAAGQRVVEAFHANAAVGAVGHIERFNAATRELRRRLVAGELGQIIQIATRRQGPFPPRITDVGVAKDLATHDVDLVAWLGGSPYERVWAQISHVSGRVHEDAIIITGRLENGVIANSIVNWLSPLRERVTVVTGERGVFVADTLNGTLTLYPNTADEQIGDSGFRGVAVGEPVEIELTPREPLRVEHEAFRDAVRGDESGIVSVQDGLQALRVVEAALAAAETGAPVTL